MKCFTLLLLPVMAVAQVQPKQPESQTINRASLIASIAARSADTAYSCKLLSQGNTHESFLPVKTCPGIAAWNTGTVLVAFAGQRTMHKLGWHRFESLPNWLSAGGSLSGIIYSLNRKHYKPPNNSFTPVPHF